MNRAVFKKIRTTSLFFLAMIMFLFYLPMTGFAEEVCPLRVEVSPYQVNIDAGGAAHEVRVLTYTAYSNTGEAFVYIDENEYPVNSEYIELTRDSIGHLVVKIDLDALQEAQLEPYIHHYLKIAVILKTSEEKCVEKVGVGEMYITGKKGS